jgi:hypothetical protein
MLPNKPSPQDMDAHNRQAVDAERAEMLLAKGQIVDIQNAILWGSNYAKLVSIQDQTLQTTAVYKPQRGERPLWDFPNGTLCYRETAAYLVSQALGWQLVPPTVLREDGPHGLGSLQLFIRHKPEITYFSLDERFNAQLQRYSLFDFIVNNADRKGGHLLLDPDTHKLWGIDHGLTFHPSPKLRTVIWDFAGQPVSDRLIASIQKLHNKLTDPDSTLRPALNRLINSAEIEALQRRIQHLLDCKLFPQPGSGRNHPWPPV